MTRLTSIVSRVLEIPGMLLVGAGWLLMVLADRVVAQLRAWEEGRGLIDDPDEGWE